jgi:RHS repeat-associated protein
MAAEIIGPDSGTAKTVYYLSNHRGDTMLAYRNNNGNTRLVAEYRYDAFGNQQPNYCVVYESENAPRYTFSTKEYLSDAKLYLYAYRVYDPIAGRWTQRDPIDYQDSINLYQFCGNNPVNGIDKDGQRLIVRGSPEYVAKVIAHLREINQVPEIRNVINVLIDSDLDHYIIDQKDTDKIPSTEPRYKNNYKNVDDGKRVESVIKIDPNDTRTANGQSANPKGALTHELQHAADMDQGKLKGQVALGKRKPAEKRANNLRRKYLEKKHKKR